MIYLPADNSSPLLLVRGSTILLAVETDEDTLNRYEKHVIDTYGTVWIDDHEKEWKAFLLLERVREQERQTFVCQECDGRDCIQTFRSFRLSESGLVDRCENCGVLDPDTDEITLCPLCEKSTEDPYDHLKCVATADELAKIGADPDGKLPLVSVQIDDLADMADTFIQSSSTTGART